MRAGLLKEDSLTLLQTLLGLRLPRGVLVQGNIQLFNRVKATSQNVQ
jgi:hypothetical protein